MFELEVPAPALTDALQWPDATAAELASAVPVPQAGIALSALDAATLTHAGRVDLLVALERQAAWLAAAQQRVLAAMAADGAAGDEIDRSGRQWVREDVSCALRLSGVTAQHRLVVARTLVERLRATLRLLDRGEISYLHAMSLADAVQSLDEHAAAAVEQRVLGRAGEQTLSEFKRSARRAVARVDAAGTEQRRAEAMSERRVCTTTRDDGMAELWALLPAEGAAAVQAAIEALASVQAAIEALASVTSADDPRTADQRRADALVDLGVAELHDPLLPRAQGMRPAVQVTVSLSTLLGCDDQPGELSGHGPIPAGVARRIAADPSGTWRRLVTDPVTGALLDYGRSTYRPPADLAEFVIARDGTCAFPTCSRAARRCDLDHRVAREAGGRTSPHNLQPLCRRHHRLEHTAGWHLGRDPSGVCTWTGPTGHRYRSRPLDLPAYAVPRGEPPPF